MNGEELGGEDSELPDGVRLVPAVECRGGCHRLLFADKSIAAGIGRTCAAHERNAARRKQDEMPLFDLPLDGSRGG